MIANLPEIILWVALGTVIYSYALYPVLLFLVAALVQLSRDLRFVLRRQSRRARTAQAALPTVSLLLAAHNEEQVIDEKIRNLQALTYPAELLQVRIGLDAPSDSTAQRVARLAPGHFQVVQFPERRGKLAVLHDLIAGSSGEIIVTTDANTLLEAGALEKLVRHFANPRVGAVCTEVDVTDPSGKIRNESLYWRYEVALKFLENRLGCVLGGTGGFYAFRRSVFVPVQAVVEDLVIVMNILYAGHMVVYDPECRSTEPAAPTLGAEFGRKVRIAAGCFQAFFANPRYLNPLRGFPAVAYLSHKVLRWFAPLLLVAGLLANLFLLASPAYQALLLAQVLFYGLAAAGHLLSRSGRAPGLLSAPLYFVSMNVAFLMGLFRFATGAQATMWAATPRTVANTREGADE